MRKSFRIFGLALFCFAMLACSQNEGTRIQSNGPSKPSPGPDDGGNPNQKPRPAETNISTLLTFSLAAIIEVESLVLSLAELDFPDQKASCPSSDFNPNSPILDKDGNLNVRLHWSQCRTFGAIGFEYAVIQLDPELPPAEAIRLKRIKSAKFHTGTSALILMASVSGKSKRFPLEQILNIQFIENRGPDKRYNLTFKQSMLLSKEDSTSKTENQWNTSLFGQVLLSGGKLSFENLNIVSDRSTTQRTRGQTSFTAETLNLESLPTKPLRSAECGIPVEGEMKAIYSSDRFSTLEGELALGAEGAKVSFSKVITKLIGCSENFPNFIYNLSPALVNQL